MRVRVERAEPTDVHFDDLSDLLLYTESLSWDDKLMFDYYVDDDDYGDGVCYTESAKATKGRV